MAAENWAKVPRSIVRADLSAGALKVFVALSAFAGVDRIATASQERIATELGVSRATARRWLDELEPDWILRRHRIRKRGGWGVNEYLVAPFPDDVGQEACLDVANVVGHESSVDVANAMATAEHDPGQSDGHGRARSWPHTDLQVQTLSNPDLPAPSSSPDGSPSPDKPITDYFERSGRRRSRRSVMTREAST